MSQSEDMAKLGRYTAVKTLLVLIALIGVIIIVWGLLLNNDSGTNENRANVPVQSTQQPSKNDPIPQEPANTNVTGGTTGAGTGASNDAAVPTPSPAGGVDTNQSQ